MTRTLSIILASAAAVALCDGIHIGSGATASPNSAIAIGDNAHATGAGVVAIGNGTTATSGVSIAGYQIMDASGNIPAARLTNVPAPSVSVSWNTAAKGANPTEALAVASCTYYKRTGSGTYTFSAITGLTAVPTYFVLEGFSALVLPASVQTVGSGIFRSGKKNHFTMWTTPSGTFVNFLFALP